MADPDPTKQNKDNNADKELAPNASQSRTTTTQDVDREAAHSDKRQKLTVVHKKKRRKNIVLLALIFGWILLIWLITMVRIAQAQDTEFIYNEQRTTHIEQMDNISEEMDEARAAALENLQKERKTIDERRTKHQPRIAEDAETYQDDGAAAFEDLQQGRQVIDDERVAHQKVIAPKPESWWDGWKERVFPSDYKNTNEKNAIRE